MSDAKPETRTSGKGTCEPKRTVYYVHPEYRMPEESKEKLEDAVASHVRAWECKGEETLHPFWAVERLTEDERRTAQRGNFNLTLVDTTFSVVTVGVSGGESTSVTCTAVIPIMTNAVDVKKEKELLLASVGK